jgi:hypothetical protein
VGKPRGGFARLSCVGHASAGESLALGIVCGVAAAIFGFAAAAMGITSFSVYVDGVETSATVINAGGARQGAIVEFRTRDGHLVRTDVPGSEVGRTGDTSRIRYAAGGPRGAARRSGRRHIAPATGRTDATRAADSPRIRGPRTGP